MLSSWQKARNHPITGFLNAAQQQALLREAAPALRKYDDNQKKKEEEKKKTDDAKQADDEAKAKSAVASPLPPTSVATPPVSPAAVKSPETRSAFDGSYQGTLSTPSGPRSITALVNGGSGTTSSNHPQCGPVSTNFKIGPTGDVMGEGYGFDRNCGKLTVRVVGKASPGQMQINLSAPGFLAQGTMVRSN